MIGYRLIIVPLVIPAEPAKPEIPAFTQMLHNDRWWEEFFPPGSWQTQNPKIVHTDKGILLSHTWTPVDEKKWDLHPLTIILPPSEAARAAVQSRDPAQMAGHDMWIVSAENGATIHFEEPFDFRYKNFISLPDLHDMMKAVIFPEAVPAHQKFNFTEEDYKFLYQVMSELPQESNYPNYGKKAEE